MSTRSTRVFQILGTVIWLVTIGGLAAWRTFHPSPDDVQAVVGLRLHPVASFLGAIAPALILAPAVFWVLGRMLRWSKPIAFQSERFADEMEEQTRGGGMSLFRYLILAMTLGCLVLLAYAISGNYSVFRRDPWPPILVGGGLILNLIYVWLSNRDHRNRLPRGSDDYSPFGWMRKKRS